MEPLIYKTESSFYLYSGKHNKSILLHPCLADIIRREEGLPGVNRGPAGNFSKEERNYYDKKYRFLKENGYFDRINQRERIKGRYTGEAIENRLYNNNNLVFEVTNCCNLECSYCIYGDLYRGFAQRKNEHLSMAKAKTLFDYMVEKWNSPKNRFYNKEIRIGFYGGESLLNFPFIKEMVRYARNTQLEGHHFTFGLTTNGTLLDKHMEYLAENRFHILVSLDGDEKSNGFRVFQDGRPIYKKVFDNIEKLRRRFPGYFEQYVNFNTVLHRLNSIQGIYDFFKTNYNKIPHITEVSLTNVKNDKKEVVNKLYRGIDDSLKQAKNRKELQNDLDTGLPVQSQLSRLIYRYSGDIYKKIEDLLPGCTKSTIPTASCVPLKRRVFLTVDGNILPCERVSHRHIMGRVTEDKVDIDFDKIAEKYNRYFDLLEEQCRECCGIDSCFICVLKLENPGKEKQCQYMMPQRILEHYLSETLSFIEENPGNYKKVIEEIFVE